MADVNVDKLVEVVDSIESHALTVSESLQALQAKLDRGEPLTAADLQIAVTDINRIDLLARNRQDVGH
jgi:hypothetical protein